MLILAGLLLLGMLLGGPTTLAPQYPGNLPADCQGRGTIQLDGAYLAQDKVCFLNSAGRCCTWNPLRSGQGRPLLPKNVTLPMQTTDDLVVVTSDMLLNLTLTLSGGDLAVRACLPAFTFTLLASTPDFNGQLGLGGYFWSNGVFIPWTYAPASVNYTTMPLPQTPPNPSVQLYANFFTDGSLRLTGPQGIAIPAGTYHIQPACIIYNARKNTRSPPPNVLISDPSCESTIGLTTTVQQNQQTLEGNYYEYFALDYYNGIGYIVGDENCYPGSNNGSIWFNRTMLTSFYKVQRSGFGLSRVSYIPTLDPTLAEDSLAVLTYTLTTQPPNVDVVATGQSEPGIAVSRLDPNNVATVWFSNDNPIHWGEWQMGFSLNGGTTWNLNSVNLPLDVGIPSHLLLPYPQLFENSTWNCSEDSGSWNCPPLPTDQNISVGTELLANTGLYPTSLSDNRMVVDAFDVFWQVGLYGLGPSGPLYASPNGAAFANAVVSYSLDYGQTWSLAGDIAMSNGSAYSYDYTVAAAGPDGKGGSQFCVAIKLDVDLNEFLTFGTTLPIELNCFHTAKRGIVDSITRVSVPGTNAGHYGGMAIGKDGIIYLNLQGMMPTILDSNGFIIATSAGPYGSNQLANAPVFFTKCTASPNVVCQPAKIIARVDYANVAPNPQFSRGTWSQPRMIVDKHNNLYVLYYDAVRNPLPTAQDQFFFINNFQETRILMIKSCDGGMSWGPPQAIHDDSLNNNPYSTPNIHFNLAVQYDPITNTILAAWLDTRIDPSSQTAVQIYAAVITL